MLFGIGEQIQTLIFLINKRVIRIRKILNIIRILPSGFGPGTTL